VRHHGLVCRGARVLKHASRLLPRLPADPADLLAPNDAGADSSYYANWSGLGVEYKTNDDTPRVIFWSRYLDWVVTGPVCRLCPLISL
jgi:hypothetical protein